MDQPSAIRSPRPPEAPAARMGPGPILGEDAPSDRGVRPSRAARVTPGRPQHLLELACRVVQAPWGGIGLLSADGELVEHLAHGVADETAAELVRSSWATELLHFVLRRTGPTCLDDLSQECSQLGTPPGLPPIGPFLGVPLHFPGRCQGALYVGRVRASQPFGPEDEELVQPICTWLELGRVFEEAHFQAQIQLLNRVAQSSAGSLDLTRILSGTLRELDRHLPLHICAVWLVEEAERTLDGLAVAEPASSDKAPSLPPGPVFLTLAQISTACRERANALGLVPGRRLLLEQTPFTACVLNSQPLYTDWNGGQSLGRHPVRSSGRGENSEPDLVPSSGASPGAACFAVPLRAGDRNVGVLQSLLTRPSGFTRDQIQLLYLVADLLGPAISNCQLYGRLRTAYEDLHLAQSQLIQAEKMRALGELASGMAHEFNNSLCGVLGFLELSLLSKGLDPSCRGYLESARVCALDATETVRRVQDFARRQQDGLSVKVLELDELVRQTLDLVRHKWEDLVHARSTPIELQVRTEAAGRVAGSPTELREVITNLVFNAVDAMPQGGTLTVRSWSTSLDAFLSVQDTGVGIAPAIRHRLFEPFFTTKGERGNGLGLSVVFGIVRRHRGEITVESQVGRGSTFTVRLPLAGDRDELEEATPVSAPAAAGSPGLRILVIEDDENVRQFLGKGLTALGHRPHLTANGRDGLAAFQEGSFDLVLTDLGLPGLSGEEVARQISEQAPGVPVVVLTGWADQLRAEKGTIQGVAGVLGKPVALDTLAATLASACPPRS